MIQNNSQDSELLELGKRIKNFYDAGYISKPKALLFSFLQGVATGVGVFIGGTLVVAALLWFLSLFNELPIIGLFVDTVSNSLHK